MSNHATGDADLAIHSHRGGDYLHSARRSILVANREVRDGESSELRRRGKRRLAAVLRALGGVPDPRRADRGPELALRYAGSLRACSQSQWLDPAWADGGVLIDLDRSRLLFFGDELMVDMAQRRAMLAVLPDLWRGYSVGWAYDGLAELAAYVGVDGYVGRGDVIPQLRLAKNATRCVTWSRSSTTPGGCGCGRCGGNSARLGTARPCWTGSPGPG